jgi:hypothetical protein
MKTPAALAALAALAVTAGASSLDFAYRLPAEIQTPGPQALPELTWQQGATPLIRVDVLSRGRPVDADTNTTVRMIIGQTATNLYYVVASNSLTTGTSYYVQWPTVGTNSAGTNTTAQAWWYTIYFERAGHRYWTGNGSLYIEATTSTAEDGLDWQTITSGYAAWGTITGAITSQTDLVAALAGKAGTGDVAVIKTNYFPLQSGLAVSNDLEIVKTNYAQLPDLAAVSSAVNVVTGNVGTVSGLLDTVVADLSSVSGAVNVVTGNLGVVSGALDTAVANLGAVSGAVNVVTGNLGAVSSVVNVVTGNLGAVSGVVNVVTGNLGAVSGALDTAIANIGSVSGAVNIVTGDLASVSGMVNVVTGNLGSVSGTVDTAIANLAAVSNAFTNHQANGDSDRNHLTDAEKAVATNPPDLSAWSEYPATTNIRWIVNVVTQVVTNLVVTGTLTPDVTGEYDFVSAVLWTNSIAGSFIYGVEEPLEPGMYYWTLQKGDVNWSSLYSTTPEGEHISSEQEFPITTGTATVAYSFVTNVVTNAISISGLSGTHVAISTNTTVSGSVTATAFSVSGTSVLYGATIVTGATPALVTNAGVLGITVPVSVGPTGATGATGATGEQGPAGPVTNQVVTYAGVVYTITNDPSTVGDVLYFDPATSNAYFGAAAAGLSIDGVRAAEPLMTNSGGVAVGLTANGGTSGTAVGRQANGSSYGAAIGREANGSSHGGTVGHKANGSSYGAAIGREANGSTRGVAVGYLADGSSYGAAVGHSADGKAYGSALGAYANGTGTNIAIGARATATGGPNRTAIGYMTTNPVNNSTRVRGDLYLDGGSNVFVRPAFGSGEFAPLANVESPYQAWTVLDPGEGETCTVTAAHGSLVAITATNGLTTIEFDNAGYGTQGVSRVGIELWAGTNSIAFDTVSITNPTAPTISTSAWNSLFFRRTADNAKWEGRQ